MNGKNNAYSFTNEDFFAILGAHNISKTNETGRITIGVKSIHVHPDVEVYNDIFDADIAILELEEKVQFSDYILPVCLAEDDTELVLNTLGYVAGFGGHETPTKFDVARFLPTPIYSFRKCTKSRDYRRLMSARSFCGGYANGTGICTGDAGSGLIIAHEGIHYLRGIVSRSLMNEYGECDKNKRSIFTDVLSFYDWINMKQNDEI